VTTPFDTQPILIPDEPIDDDPLSNGGKWTYLNGDPLRRAGGGYTTTQPGGAIGEMLWNPQFFLDAAVCWVYNNNPATSGYIAMKLRADPPATTYYLGEWDHGAGDTWVIYQATGSTPFALGTVSGGPSFLAGDRIGFAVIGTALSMWKQDRISAGVPSALPNNWTQIISTTGTTVADAGFMTLRLGGLETEVFGARGAGLFSIGTSGAFAVSSPSFDVDIRVAGRT
jgi:hypothetical protein